MRRSKISKTSSTHEPHRHGSGNRNRTTIFLNRESDGLRPNLCGTKMEVFPQCDSVLIRTLSQCMSLDACTSEWLNRDNLERVLSEKFLLVRECTDETFHNKLGQPLVRTLTRPHKVISVLF